MKKINPKYELCECGSEVEAGHGNNGRYGVCTNPECNETYYTGSEGTSGRSVNDWFYC